MSRPLFSSLPTLESRAPIVPLGTFPTPVERVQLPGTRAGVTTWVKRDDLTSDLYGGNKVRKLEFILGAARAAGRTALWTVGGIGSHHCLATAIHGREHGFEVELLHFPQPVTAHVREVVRAVTQTTATMTLASLQELPVKIAGQKLRSWFGRAGVAVEAIPVGGSSAIGTLGYVNAALEVAEQVAAGEMPAPDQVYVPLGSCGTAVGLSVGFALAGLRPRLVGIRVVDRLVANPLTTSRITTGLRALLGRDVDPVPIESIEGYFGGGYGVPTVAAERAIGRASGAGLPTLEGTYSGKTAAALFDDLRSGAAHGNVLFWNTYNSAPLSLAPFDEVPASYRDLLAGDDVVAK